MDTKYEPTREIPLHKPVNPHDRKAPSPTYRIPTPPAPKSEPKEN